MLRFANLEDALNAMGQQIHSDLLDYGDTVAVNQANSAAKEIDREVKKFFTYMKAIIGTQKTPDRIRKGGEVWKPLTRSWTKRKQFYGVPTPNYFVGLSQARKEFGMKTRSESLLDYVSKLQRVSSRASFLGNTAIYNEAAKMWRPPDARIISWTDLRGRVQRRWFGTSQSGHKGFIPAPSDKEFRKIMLWIMPEIDLDDPDLELQMATRFAITGGSPITGRGRQDIKILGHNRKVFKPLVTWMYNNQIKRILRKVQE